MRRKEELMPTMRILSWNVNGLRAVHKKGFLEWLKRDRPDILCIQETKCKEDQVPNPVKNAPGYDTYFSSGDKKGYGGVGLFTRKEPLSVKYSLEIESFDDEGRAIVADYGSFILFNAYFPNGKASKERLDYKLEFSDHLLERVDRLKAEGRKIVICGDVNTAHNEIDISRPKQNEKISGFLPVERAWMDKLVAHSFLDTFRIFNKEGGNYSWWDQKTKARERNVGWRIDYFFVSDNLRDSTKSAFIMKEVNGSDHCPVGIEIIQYP
jgi:exodeoxyribonuclease-3